MGWYPNNDGRDMGPDLDRWITGNYGEDAMADSFCHNCRYLETYGDVELEGGTCIHKHSPHSWQDVDPEDWCDHWERRDL
jgi:hypothetical protein